MSTPNELLRLRRENRRLRAALKIARDGIMGHFDDGCPDCQSAVATINRALLAEPAPERQG